ncbi:cytochrome P450 [Amycolatopsis sp. NPDC051716]|uniref:cytochrome P450 n=1 Tax=Amycolatopsis sp. NPDC051716 TaxID=3155804 RepID=UPI00343C8421
MSDSAAANPRLPVERRCPFDPAENYAALTKAGPIARLAMPVSVDGRDGWVATGLDEVRRILADDRFSHRKDLISLSIPSPIPTGDDREQVVYRAPAPEPGAFIAMDPPEHMRYRRLLAGYFTVRRVRELAPMIEQVAQDCLDALADAGPGADLVELFAEPFPIRVMCELMGIPPGPRAPLAKHLAVVSRMSYTVEELTEAVVELGRLLTEIVRQKRENPTADLLGELAATGELTDGELINIAWALLGGGFDTSGNMLGLGVFALLEHPEQLARLRAEPELLDNAVEELLRYLTVSHLGASRAALTDVAIGGETIEQGQTVVVALPVANRDPARFPDPGVLDLGRNTQGHVAFGHGVHQCLGQHLARLTLRIGYRALFERFGSLRLAVPADEVPTKEDMLHYGVYRLPVTWDETAG